MLVLTLVLAQSTPVALGTWSASLASPGGELRFGLELWQEGTELRAAVRNPPESIPVPAVRIEGAELVLDFPHYDSRIRATIADEGRTLSGTWEKRRSKERWTRMDFSASSAATEPLASSYADVSGRWAVDFESDDQPAVALFEQRGTSLGGTILTATGDYRFLAGAVEGQRLTLSCFDGAHAFLFTAQLFEDERLQGDFWSADSWHETWTAQRDAAARLADPYAQTSWDERASLADYVLPDLEGVPRSLAEPLIGKRAAIVQLFGSWCPNCHDETALLVELERRWRERGLAVLGIAFEVTGEFARDAALVRTMAAKHEIDYPLFVAGVNDKERASRAFPAIDRLRAFPTTIFVDGNGRVRAVHSGFSGQATGAEHAALQSEFEGWVQECLETPVDDRATWSALTAHVWFDPSEFAGATWTFRDAGDGRREVHHVVHKSGVPVISEEVLAVRSFGDAVFAGARHWRLDRAADVLLDPRDVGARLSPRGGGPAPLVAGRALAALASSDARERREALFAIACERGVDAGARFPEALPLLDDPALDVRTTAAWAMGRCDEARAIERLLLALEHANAALRREAVRALGRLLDGAARESALGAALDDADPLVRRAAHSALERP
jgi:thiol-disulfide isomerase/thioredoxin